MVINFAEWDRSAKNEKYHHAKISRYIVCVLSVFHPDQGGQTRVLKMLRRGGIKYQAVRQTKVKIQGEALRIQGGGGGGGGGEQMPPFTSPPPKWNPDYVYVLCTFHS